MTACEHRADGVVVLVTLGFVMVAAFSCLLVSSVAGTNVLRLPRRLSGDAFSKILLSIPIFLLILLNSGDWGTLASY